MSLTLKLDQGVFIPEVSCYWQLWQCIMGQLVLKFKAFRTATPSILLYICSCLLKLQGTCFYYSTNGLPHLKKRSFILKGNNQVSKQASKQIKTNT